MSFVNPEYLEFLQDFIKAEITSNKEVDISQGSSVVCKITLPSSQKASFYKKKLIERSFQYFNSEQALEFNKHVSLEENVILFHNQKVHSYKNIPDYHLIIKELKNILAKISRREIYNETEITFDLEFIYFKFNEDTKYYPCFSLKKIIGPSHYKRKKVIIQAFLPNVIVPKLVDSFSEFSWGVDAIAFILNSLAYEVYLTDSYESGKQLAIIIFRNLGINEPDYNEKIIYQSNFPNFETFCEESYDYKPPQTNCDAEESVLIHLRLNGIISYYGCLLKDLKRVLFELSSYKNPPSISKIVKTSNKEEIPIDTLPKELVNFDKAPWRKYILT